MTYPAVGEQDEPAPTTPVKKKRTGLAVLSAVFVLLLAALGAMGYLYLDVLSRRDALTTQLSDLDQRQWDATKDVLAGNDLLSKALTAQHNAEDVRDNTQSSARIMVECQKFVREMREADLGGGTDEAFQAAASRVFRTC